MSSKMDSKYVYILVALFLSSFVRYSLSETSSTTTTTTTTTTTSTTTKPTTKPTTKLTTKPTTTSTTTPTTIPTTSVTTQISEPHEPYKSSTIGLGVAFSLSLILNIILIVWILKSSQDEGHSPPRNLPDLSDECQSVQSNDYHSSPNNVNRAGTQYEAEIGPDNSVRDMSTRTSQFPSQSENGIYINGGEYHS